MSSKKFNPFKDLQSDQIQRGSFKIFTAHYTCRNADLNLTVVMVATNGFIFQIINSLIESWGVPLTSLDWKALDFNWFSPQPYSHQKTTKHIPIHFMITGLLNDSCMKFMYQSSQSLVQHLHGYTRAFDTFAFPGREGRRGWFDNHSLLGIRECREAVENLNPQAS